MYMYMHIGLAFIRIIYMYAVCILLFYNPLNGAHFWRTSWRQTTECQHPWRTESNSLHLRVFFLIRKGQWCCSNWSTPTMIYQLLGRLKQGISNRRYCTGNRITYSFLVATKDGRQMTKEEGRPHQTHCQCQNRASKQYRGALPACVRTRPHALRIPYCTRNTSRSIILYRYIMYI